jgi:hypothetical protein
MTDPLALVPPAITAAKTIYDLIDSLARGDEAGALEASRAAHEQIRILNAKLELEIAKRELK